MPAPRSIAKELEEAKHLREEAAKVLADYERKQGDAAKEAQAIIKLASKEAEELAAETRRSMAEHFERRMKLAEDKIARAETEALRRGARRSRRCRHCRGADGDCGEAHAGGRRRSGQAGHRCAQDQAELAAAAPYWLSQFQNDEVLQPSARVVARPARLTRGRALWPPST